MCLIARIFRWIFWQKISKNFLLEFPFKFKKFSLKFYLDFPLNFPLKLSLDFSNLFLILLINFFPPSHYIFHILLSKDSLCQHFSFFHSACFSKLFCIAAFSTHIIENSSCTFFHASMLTLGISLERKFPLNVNEFVECRSACRVIMEEKEKKAFQSWRKIRSRDFEKENKLKKFKSVRNERIFSDVIDENWLKIFFAVSETTHRHQKHKFQF